MQLKNRLNIYAREGVRLCNRFFFVLPVKNNRILFESMEGRGYFGNPKYLSEYIQEHFPNQCEIYWAFNNPDNQDLSESIHKIKFKSLKYNFIRSTSKVIVQNTPPVTFVPLRKNQLSINTWHGGGSYKKVGYSNESVESKKDILMEWRRSMMSRQINLFVSSSAAFTKQTIKDSYRYNGEVMECGMPRNDIFFDEEKIRRARNKVKETYHTSDFIVLYAPTYRGEYEHSDRMDIQFPIEDIRKAIKNKYGKESTFLIRKHHADKNDYAVNGSIDASGYPDMQELLCACDILITDYSSSIWDYSFTGKPCYLYVYDLDRYDSNRGFYSPIEEWPGIICRNAEELTGNIEAFDATAYKKKLMHHHESLKSYEEGKATEKIVGKIMQFINLRGK